MKNIFRKLKKPARYTALAVVILFGLSYIYLRFIVRDIPKFDDSRMELKYTPVPVQENAFPLLVMAEISLNDPLSEDLLKELTSIRFELKKNKGRLTPKTEMLVNLHFREKIMLLERAGSMKYSQATLPHDKHYRDPWNQKILNYVSLKALAELRLAMARKDFDEGHAEQAVHGALAMLNVGSSIQHRNGGSSLISIMISHGIEQSSLETLNEFISAGYISEGVTEKDMMSDLTSARESKRAWENAWKEEYAVCGAVLDAWKEGRVNLSEYIFDSKSRPGRIAGNIIFGIIMKPEKARKNCFDFYTRQIINTNVRSYSETNLTMPKFGYSFRMLMRGDLGTNLFEAVAFPNFLNGLQHKSHSDFLINATILRIGILSYHKEFGHFPDKLDDLVPEFISEIPKDPFDGKPLRYDKKRQIIYSVGLNLKDDGGNVQGKYKSPFSEIWFETRNREDIVVKLLR